MLGRRRARLGVKWLIAGNTGTRLPKQSAVVSSSISPTIIMAKTSGVRLHLDYLICIFSSF